MASLLDTYLAKCKDYAADPIKPLQEQLALGCVCAHMRMSSSLREHTWRLRLGVHPTTTCMPPSLAPHMQRLWHAAPFACARVTWPLMVCVAWCLAWRGVAARRVPVRSIILKGSDKALFNSRVTTMQVG